MPPVVADDRDVRLPTLSASLRVRGSLRVRAHGNVKHAHLVLRKVHEEEFEDSNGCKRRRAIFSLFAHKLINVKAGKELYLYLHPADGDLQELPIAFEGELLGPDEEAVEATDDVPADTSKKDVVEESIRQEQAVPPKMRKRWMKKTEVGGAVSSTVINPVPPAPVKISVETQTLQSVSSTAVQTASSLSVSGGTQTVSSLSISGGTQTATALHVDSGTQTVCPSSSVDIGVQTSEPPPLPAAAPRLPLPAAAPRLPLPAHSSSNPNAGSDVRAVSSDPLSEVEEQERDESHSRSLSPMELESPVTTPSQSPLLVASKPTPVEPDVGPVPVPLSQRSLPFAHVELSRCSSAASGDTDIRSSRTASPMPLKSRHRNIQHTIQSQHSFNQVRVESDTPDPSKAPQSGPSLLSSSLPAKWTVFAPRASSPPFREPLLDPTPKASFVPAQAKVKPIPLVNAFVSGGFLGSFVSTTESVNDTAPSKPRDIQDNPELPSMRSCTVPKGFISSFAPVSRGQDKSSLPSDNRIPPVPKFPRLHSVPTAPASLNKTFSSSLQRDSSDSGYVVTPNAVASSSKVTVEQSLWRPLSPPLLSPQPLPHSEEPHPAATSPDGIAPAMVNGHKQPISRDDILRVKEEVLSPVLSALTTLPNSPPPDLLAGNTAATNSDPDFYSAPTPIGDEYYLASDVSLYDYGHTPIPMVQAYDPIYIQDDVEYGPPRPLPSPYDDVSFVKLETPDPIPLESTLPNGNAEPRHMNDTTRYGNGANGHYQKSRRSSSTYPPPPKLSMPNWRKPRTSRKRRIEAASNEQDAFITSPSLTSFTKIYTGQIRYDAGTGLRAISFNSTGSHFAVICHDHTIRIWSNNTRTEVAKLAHNASVISVAWMDGISGVVSLGLNGVVNKWSWIGQNQWHWARILDAGDTDPSGLAYRHDRIAVAYPRIGVKVWILDRGSWQPQRTIIRQNVVTIKFVEGGDALIGGTSDGVLWHCHVPNGSIRAYTFFKTKVFHADIDPMGEYAIVSQAGGRAHLVSLKQDDERGKILQVYSTREVELNGRTNYPFGALFASSGNLVVFGAIGDRVLVWDRHDGKVKYELNHGNDVMVQAIASFDNYSSEGYLLTGNRLGKLVWWAPPVHDDESSGKRQRTDANAMRSMSSPSMGPA